MANTTDAPGTYKPAVNLSGKAVWATLTGKPAPEPQNPTTLTAREPAALETPQPAAPPKTRSAAAGLVGVFNILAMIVAVLGGIVLVVAVFNFDSSMGAGAFALVVGSALWTVFAWAFLRLAAVVADFIDWRTQQ